MDSQLLPCGPIPPPVHEDVEGVHPVNLDVEEGLGDINIPPKETPEAIVLCRHSMQSRIAEVKSSMRACTHRTHPSLLYLLAALANHQGSGGLHGPSPLPVPLMPGLPRRS